LTDGELVRLARRIDKLGQEYNRLLDSVIECGHPNAIDVAEAIYANAMHTNAWATHVFSHYLIQSHRWETGDYGIRAKKDWVRKRSHANRPLKINRDRLPK